METRVHDVPLRERATPYDYVVTVQSGDKVGDIYQGRAYREAIRSYWQAVGTLRFLSASGDVEVRLALNKMLYGGFSTVISEGGIVQLHKPSGKCSEWVTRGWTGQPIEEKLIATIPGTLGLPRDPNA